MEKEEFVICNSLIKRDFIIKYNDMEHRTTQLQMVNWPDHSSPDEETGYQTIEYIINFTAEIRANYNYSPILTHCSAGTGRTGTFIAIFNIIKCLCFIKIINQNIDSQHRIKPFFSVFNVVRKLREQRIGMVSSHLQYNYIYEFCLEWTKKNLDVTL